MADAARKTPAARTREPSPLLDVARVVKAAEAPGTLTLAQVPDGFDAFVAADLVRALARGRERSAVLVHVAREGQRAQAFRDALAFAAPEIEVLDFPAWDCQPYDRVSPQASIEARRMTVLSRLARSKSSRERPRIVSTTVSAITQRMPPRATVAAESFSAAPGNSVATDDLVAWLETNGFPAVRHGARYRRICGAGRHRRSVRARHAAAGPPRFLRPYAGIDPHLRSRDAALDRADARLRSRADERGAAHQRRHAPLPPGLRHRLRGADARRHALRGDQRRPAPPGHGALAAAVLRRSRHAVRLSRRGAAAARRAGRRGRLRAFQEHRGPPRLARRRSRQADGCDLQALPADALYLTPADWAERLGKLAVLRTTASDPAAEDKRVVACGGRPAATLRPSGPTRAATSSTPR